MLIPGLIISNKYLLDKTDPNEFDITQFIADLSTTLANIAAILKKSCE